MNKKFFIIIIVVAVLVVGVFAFIGLRKGGGEGNKSEELVTEGIEWLVYKSEKYGYQIDYPSDWILDVSQEKYPADVIYRKGEDAMMAISIFQNPKVLEEGGMEQVLKEVENVFKGNSSYVIETWETSSNGFLAAGSYFVENVEWRFKEAGMYTNEGIGVDLRGNIKKDLAGEVGLIMDKMFTSFKSIE